MLFLLSNVQLWIVVIYSLPEIKCSLMFNTVNLLWFLWEKRKFWNREKLATVFVKFCDNEVFYTAESEIFFLTKSELGEAIIK